MASSHRLLLIWRLVTPAKINSGFYSTDLIRFPPGTKTEKEESNEWKRDIKWNFIIAHRPFSAGSTRCCSLVPSSSSSSVVDNYSAKKVASLRSFRFFMPRALPLNL